MARVLNVYLGEADTLFQVFIFARIFARTHIYYLINYYNIETFYLLKS